MWPRVDRRNHPPGKALFQMQMEQLIGTRRVFAGKLVAVRVDTVRLPDGAERTREVVEHPGAVAILPVLSDGRLVLVRQYRHAIGRSLLEVPAGTLEKGETPEACAARELEEETGYRAASLRRLVRFYVSPGWATEQLTVFVAEDVQSGAARPAPDERIDVVEVRPDEVPDLIAGGEIADAKTIVALVTYLGLRLPPA